MKNQTSENRGFNGKASKIVHEWNGHLQILSCPQVIENSRQYLFSKQIFHRKQSLGAPEKTKNCARSGSFQHKLHTADTARLFLTLMLAGFHI